MPKPKSILLAILAIIITASPLLLSQRALAASSASMYLSPSAATITQGAQLTIDLRENSGNDPVNVVQADLSYPADKLRVLTITPSSTFSIKAKESYGNGSINLVRGAVPALTGDQSVVTITFEATMAYAIATIDINKSGSFVLSSSSHQDILKETRGGNYTITLVPDSSGSAANSPPAVNKDTRAPKISNLKVTNLGSDNPTVSWKTSEPATSQVDYGLNKNYGLSTGDAKYVTSHQLILNSPLIQPATLYHFMVKSTDAAGNIAASTDGTFTVKGLSLLITVVNQRDQVVPSAKVSLGEQSGTTDRNGHLTLGGFPLGELVGTVDYGGRQTVVSSEVKPLSGQKTPQSVTFTIKTNPANAWLMTLPVIFLGVLLRLISKSKIGLLKSKIKHFVFRTGLN